MGHGKRTGPKSSLLTALYFGARAALDYDWLTRFGFLYQPLRWSRWSEDPDATSPISFAMAWNLTREILRDRTSHSYHALAGSSYVPTAEEMNAWDMLAVRKQLKHARYRPWLDRRNDWLKPPHTGHLATKEQLEGRAKLKAMFHIKD